MGDWTLPTLAVVLMGYAAFSQRVQSSWLSQAMLFTLVGLGVGSQALDLVELDAASQLVRHFAAATLALLLFTDAARINLGRLRRQAQLPLRLLGVGLPLTIVTGTAGALVFFPQLGLWPAAALATILAPTDAALGQPVVVNTRLPSTVRQGLNVESGLNDGICVPLLIIFLTFAEAKVGVAGFNPLLVLAEEVGFGALSGVAAAILGGCVLRTFGTRGWMSRAWQQINVLAVPLLAYTLAVALGGSGFIAAFVAGMVFAAVTSDEDESCTALGEQTGEVFDALTFLLFGAVLLGPALEDLDWQIVGYALLSLTVVRLLPVGLALLGMGLHPSTILFVGWFGPRGLASIVFVLLMVEESDLAEASLMLTVVTTTVALSVLLHGITAWPGVNRYADWFAAHGEASMPESAEVTLPRVRKHAGARVRPSEDTR